MCLWNMDAPGGNKFKIWKNLKSNIFIPPQPQGHVREGKCEQPLNEHTLQSKFDYCMTTLLCLKKIVLNKQIAEWKSTVKVTLILTTIGQSHLRNVHRPAITCWITILPFFHKKQRCFGSSPWFSQDFPKSLYRLFLPNQPEEFHLGRLLALGHSISCYFVIKSYDDTYRTTHFDYWIYNFEIRSFYCIEDYNGIPLPLWEKPFWKFHWF